ncbi:MAG: DUF1736 domain-containing protein [Saprospiraceae bacterium]|nr:DUF1736 domain-containing protein [Saprospiraceae bacterium]
MAGVPKFSQEIKDIMNNPFLSMKPDQKLGSIMYTLLKYIQLMVWPHPLSHDYYPYAIPKISVFKPIPLLSLFTYISLWPSWHSRDGDKRRFTHIPFGFTCLLSRSCPTL